MNTYYLKFSSEKNLTANVRKTVKKDRFQIPCKVVAIVDSKQTSEFHIEQNYSPSGIGVYETKRNLLQVVK